MKGSALRRYAVAVAVALLLAGACLLATGTRIGVGWGMLLSGLALGWVCVETASTSASTPPSRTRRER